MVTRDKALEHHAAIFAIAGGYGAHDIRIFGSVARGDAGESSDLDLVVRLEPDRSLPDHGGWSWTCRTSWA